MQDELQQDYTDLTPETILSAVESLGYEGSGRLLALNSYENRVYRCELESGEAIIAKFYRPNRWSDVAIDEEHDNHPHGQPHAALWILDVTERANIRPLSVFEVSEVESPWSRSGSRFGASQIVERPTGNLTFAAWFAGGLRVIDIGDPLAPREYGYFVPPPPAGFTAPQSMDVEVDERGIIYLLDRNSGIDILEIS